MTKQTLAIGAAAIVLFAAAVVGALAFTGGSDDNVHTMQDGSTMSDEGMTTEAP